jgi:hypothetical protein
MIKLMAALILFTFLLSATPLLASNDAHLYPSIDLIIPRPLAKDFRLPTDPFHESDRPLPTRFGLDSLRCSASGQFTETNIVLMLMRHPAKKIIVIDLREESHGYLNGYPISWKFPGSTWTNIGKSTAQILKDEQMRLRKLFERKIVVLDPDTDPLKLEVFNTMTEEQLVKRYNMDYLRLPITENHRPNDVTVDAIVSLIQKLPADTWIHAHCHGGKGRTTSFLVMYDSLINGKNVSFDQILERQRLLGGTDMYKKKLELKKEVENAYNERVEFLKKFYDYVTSVDTMNVTWSEWVKTHP